MELGGRAEAVERRPQHEPTSRPSVARHSGHECTASRHCGTQKGMRQHGQHPTKHKIPAAAQAKQPGVLVTDVVTVACAGERGPGSERESVGKRSAPPT